MAALHVTEFTDPMCPFAWSAEPVRRALDWRYGDGLSWSVRVVGLADTRQDYADKGFTPEKLSTSYRRLSAAHGMPMDTSLRPAVAATMAACRAVVAARLHAPQTERPVLRALRVRNFAGQLLDDPATLRGAAADAGLQPERLEDWLAQEQVEAALQDDLRAARHPTPAALALDHKLASFNGGRRYTCPSYEFERMADGARAAVPGFQPAAASEVAIANLAPGLERREAPDDVEAVLRWANEPLATAEVAAVCELDLDEARQQLGRVARERPMGADGLWSLA